MAHRSSFPYQRSRGNTITEYALVGVLIVGACIMVFDLLGGNLNAVFAGTKSKMLAKTQNAAQWNAAQASQASAYKAGAAAAAAQYSSLTGGGSSSSVIQVTAANGSTVQAFINNLNQITSTTTPQALTPDQIKEMERTMSNLASQIASLEKQLQNLLAYAGNDPAKFMTATLNVGGVTISAIDLANQLNNAALALDNYETTLSNTNASASDLAKMAALVKKTSGDAAVIYSKSQTLQSQYQADLASQLLAQANQAAQAAQSTTDPAAKAALTAQATAAASSAQVAQSTSSQAAATSSSAAQTATTAGSSTTQDPATITSTTTGSATTMCKTGNGQASSSQCTP